MDGSRVRFMSTWFMAGRTVSPCVRSAQDGLRELRPRSQVPHHHSMPRQECVGRHAWLHESLTPPNESCVLPTLPFAPAIPCSSGTSSARFAALNQRGETIEVVQGVPRGADRWSSWQCSAVQNISSRVCDRRLTVKSRQRPSPTLPRCAAHFFNKVPACWVAARAGDS